MKVKDTDGVIYKFYDYQIGKPHSDVVINGKRAFRIATPRGDITVYADYWARLNRRNKIKDWIFRILYCLFCLVPQAILIVCAICVSIAIYVFVLIFPAFVVWKYTKWLRWLVIPFLVSINVLVISWGICELYEEWEDKVTPKIIDFRNKRLRKRKKDSKQ